MTVEELVSKCKRALANEDDVQLVIGREARGQRITLAGTGSPLSVDMSCLMPGETVAWFNPKTVLDWIEKNS